MFREELDPVTRRYHDSYYKSKDVPKQQLVAMHTNFDNGHTHHHDASHHAHAVMPDAVPTTWDSRYDPQHPDADFAGLRPNRATRRHADNHPSQRTHIGPSDVGLAGCDDFVLSRKKREPAPRYNLITGEPLIGGAGAPRGGEAWRSEYQRLVAHEPTSTDMLTLKRQHEILKGQPVTAASSSAAAVSAAAGGGGGGTYYPSPSPRRPGAAALLSPRRGVDVPGASDVTGERGLARGRGGMIGDLGGSLLGRVPEFTPNAALAQPRPKILVVENYEKNYKRM